jgi:hypothetical protein
MRFKIPAIVSEVVATLTSYLQSLRAPFEDNAMFRSFYNLYDAYVNAVTPKCVNNELEHKLLLVKAGTMKINPDKMNQWFADHSTLLLALPEGFSSIIQTLQTFPQKRTAFLNFLIEAQIAETERCRIFSFLQIQQLLSLCPNDQEAVYELVKTSLPKIKFRTDEVFRLNNLFPSKSQDEYMLLVQKNAKTNENLAGESGYYDCSEDPLRSAFVAAHFTPKINTPAGFEIDHDITERQLGWNCFDVAVGAKRAEIVKYALDHAADQNMRDMLAVEIRHAVAHTITCLETPALANDYAAEAAMLPRSMRYNKEMAIAYKQYQDAHNGAEVRALWIACNEALNKGEDKRLNWDELKNFFSNTGHRDNDPIIYDAAFKIFNITENNHVKPKEAAFLEFCSREQVYTQYVNEYYAENQWGAFGSEFTSENSTSMVDIAANMLGAKITIHYPNTTQKLKTTIKYGEQEIDIFWLGNHFVRLKKSEVVPTPDPAKTLEISPAAPSLAIVPYIPPVNATNQKMFLYLYARSMHLEQHPSRFFVTESVNCVETRLASRAIKDQLMTIKLQQNKVTKGSAALGVVRFKHMY